MKFLSPDPASSAETPPAMPDHREPTPCSGSTDAAWVGYVLLDSIRKCVKTHFQKFHALRMKISAVIQPVFLRSAVVGLFICILLCYAAYQHTCLTQLIDNNRALERAIAAQHERLQVLTKNHREQKFQLLEQEVTGLDHELTLMALNRRWETFTEGLAALNRKNEQLETLEKEVRSLAGLEATSVNPDYQGMGGVPPDIHPRLSLSFDAPPDKETGALEKKISLTRQYLNSRTSRLAALKRELEEKIAIAEATPSIKPTNGVVTCPFGYRLSPFTRKREFHSGMDIANRKGTPVYATARGTVVFARRKNLIGKLVTIDNGRGIITKFGHLNKILVKKGDTVNRGDLIGLMGSTGNSTGPHVHYEVVVDGTPRNPANYFTSTSIASRKPPAKNFDD